jgi:scyllo-inositol 2-dehydrogenase (NAD+)
LERLKAAVIGLGRMGGEPSSRLAGKVPFGWLPISHVESILETPSLILSGICDTDMERVKRLSDYYSIEKAYTDYEKLILEIHPYFLSIATRTKGRTEIIKYGIDNGCKAVYFEKPICNTVLEAKEILGYAEKNNVVIGYGVNRRYHSSYRKAKEILSTGELGKIEHICVEHNSANLLWAHPHSVDLILYFADTCDLEYVQGNCSFINEYVPKNFMDIDNDPLINHAFFKFKNGISASINITRGLNTRITCEYGILTIYSDGSWIEINKLKQSGYLDKGEIVEINSNASATTTVFRELVEISQGLSFKKLPITNSEIITGLLMLNGVTFSSLNGGIKIEAQNIPDEMRVSGKMGVWYA